MGSGKQRWKIFFHKSPLPKQQAQTQQKPISIPLEFLCPISSSIMADPVVVSSGHTFERNCVHACVSLSFKPTLPDGAAADFSAVLSNLALKSAIVSWCRQHLVDPPKPVDFHAAKNIVCNWMTRIELNRTPSELSVTSQCYSSSSSSEIENPSSNFMEEEYLIAKLKSAQINEQVDALVSLRNLTRTREETRTLFCTPRLLSSLKFLIASRYSNLQVNAVAALVNLSLENENKATIVRSGIVPQLIDILRAGSPESQEHAAGALFSLSIDDQNKAAIGVLGALPPLLHALRSDLERTRHDSALALYHLSLVHSNRVKLIKLGSIQFLLCMVKSGHMPGRVLLVLRNLAASVEGRAAMLDGGAVECLVSFMSRGEFDSPATRKSCLAAIYGLSYGGLRFKGLAKEARAEEMLREIEKSGSTKMKEKVRRILEVMSENEDEDEEIDWEELLNSEDDLSRALN